MTELEGLFFTNDMRVDEKFLPDVPASSASCVRFRITCTHNWALKRLDSIQ